MRITPATGNADNVHSTYTNNPAKIIQLALSVHFNDPTITALPSINYPTRQIIDSNTLEIIEK